MAGCRPSTEPSAAYEDCRRLFAGVVAERGDDAALDPRAESAAKRCDEVLPSSIDGVAAKALAARIRTERAEREAQLERLADNLTLTQGASIPGAGGGASDFAPAPLAAAVVVAAPLPVVGSESALFATRYGACVKVETPFVEKGGARRGEAFALVDSADCLAKFPELVGQLVFVADAKIFNVTGRAQAVKIEAMKTDAGLVPAPPGFVPPRVPTGEVTRTVTIPVPAKPAEGTVTVETQTFVPGGPVPEGELRP